MTKVRCSVDSCEFWGRGDVCKANSIWINSNMDGESDEDSFLDFDAEFAEELGTLNGSDQSPVRTSRNTCCETMRPRK